jgi:hypothetical protein
MARKLRVEYPGAIYHVMNRGVLQGVFATPKSIHKPFNRPVLM